MTYRIVHQLVKVLFKVVGGSCPELGVFHDVWLHPGRLVELQNLVDFDEFHSKRQIKLQVPVVDDVSCFPH